MSVSGTPFDSPNEIEAWSVTSLIANHISEQPCGSAGGRGRKTVTFISIDYTYLTIEAEPVAQT